MRFSLSACKTIVTAHTLLSAAFILRSTAACRWAVRLDLRHSYCDNQWASCTPEYVLRDAVHSLSKQATAEPFVPMLDQAEHYDARQSRLRNHKVNRDGFGVGWFDNSHPFKFIGASVRKSGQPIVTAEGQPTAGLNDALAGVKSNIIFGHIRAGSHGLNGDDRNAHPFRFTKAGHTFIWMHNGGVARWDRMREHVRTELSKETLSQIQGETDSEHCGALFLEKLGEPTMPDGSETGIMQYSPAQIAAALAEVVHELDDADQDAERLEYGEAAAQHGEACHSGSSLNFAVSDGHTIAATRYRSCRGQEPPSLYLNNESLHQHVVYLASEPLDREAGGWELIQKDEMLIATVDGELRRECLSDVCASHYGMHYGSSEKLQSTPDDL